MGIDHNAFYGPYMRIWLPQVEIDQSVRTCSNEGCDNRKNRRSIDSKCCPDCGNTVENLNYKVSCQENLVEFLDEEFGDCDLFIEVDPRDTDYILAVPNNVSRQGGWHFEDSPKSEIVSFNRDGISVDPNWVWFEKEDWQKLIKTLAEKDIKHECKVGVLQWES